VSRKTWIGRSGTDLRYAHRSASEGRKEKAGGQLSVAGELNESLVGVVGSHVGEEYWSGNCRKVKVLYSGRSFGILFVIDKNMNRTTLGRLRNRTCCQMRQPSLPFRAVKYHECVAVGRGMFDNTPFLVLSRGWSDAASTFP
jgi:hypothetical protein